MVIPLDLRCRRGFGGLIRRQTLVDHAL
jgi:hypothetical protein